MPLQFAIASDSDYLADCQSSVRTGKRNTQTSLNNAAQATKGPILARPTPPFPATPSFISPKVAHQYLNCVLSFIHCHEGVSLSRTGLLVPDS